MKWTGVEKWREKGDLRGVECSKVGEEGGEERKQETVGSDGFKLTVTEKKNMKINE